MKVEMTVLNNGVVMLVADRPMPDMVRRVEYYRDQKVFMLVYDDEEIDSEMMHYEVPIDYAMAVEKTPNILIYANYPDTGPIGYKAPLIKVGDVF